MIIDVNRSTGIVDKTHGQNDLNLNVNTTHNILNGFNINNGIYQ